MYELVTGDVNSASSSLWNPQAKLVPDLSAQGSKPNSFQRLLEALIIPKHCIGKLYEQPARADDRLFKMSCWTP